MWSLMQMAVFRPCWKPRCWLTHFLMEHGIKIWWRVRASDHLRWNPGPNSWETEQAPNFSRLYFSCLYQPHRSWGVWRFNEIILTVGVRMKWDNACYNALHMLTMDPEEPVVILFFFFQKRVHGVTESASYQHFDLLFRGLGACSKVTGTAGYIVQSPTVCLGCVHFSNGDAMLRLKSSNQVQKSVSGKDLMFGNSSSWHNSRYPQPLGHGLVPPVRSEEALD